MLMPFTYPWIIKNNLAGARTLLDVGCGDGSFMKIIRSEDIKVIGVDLFSPYLKSARRLGIYEKVLKQDIKKLKFKKKSFDVVLSSQVVEHLKRKEALKLISKMEAIAKNRVIVGTPNGYFPQEEYDKNKLQEHQSFWTKRDFEKLGFKVTARKNTLSVVPPSFRLDVTRDVDVAEEIARIVGYDTLPTSLPLPAMGQ